MSTLLHRFSLVAMPFVFAVTTGVAAPPQSAVAKPTPGDASSAQKGLTLAEGGHCPQALPPPHSLPPPPPHSLQAPGADHHHRRPRGIRSRTENGPAQCRRGVHPRRDGPSVATMGRCHRSFLQRLEVRRQLRRRFSWP